MFRRPGITVGALSLVALAGIRAQGNLVASRKTVGDTTIVHVASGSVWGNTASLVEELRIGKLDGTPEEMFTQIRDVAPDRKGGVYVFDPGGPALRHFDARGKHLVLLGGKGSGPGEYRDASLGIKVRADGRVFMRDPRNGRINVYGPNDKPLAQIPIPSGLFTLKSTVLDTAGEIYLKILLGPIQKGKPWPIGLLHLTPDGKLIDSLAPPTLAGEPDADRGLYYPRKIWEASPLGYIVAGLNTDYRFQFRRRDGKVTRIEMDHAPVRFGAEERAELDAANDWMVKNRGQFLSNQVLPTPPTKPAFSGFDIGDDGQIWVQVHVPAVKVALDPDEKPDPGRLPPAAWQEPPTFDVFQPDGTYLGRIRMPDRVSLVAHRGDEVWGTTTGESGELYLLRYRLKHR